MQKQYLSYADYLHLFQQHGGTDQGYLYGHYQRFCQTQKLFYENWSLGQGNRLLDVGAHWLHQAILYAQDGFRVTAADFPVTMTDASVKRLAAAYQIELFAYNDLSNPHEFSQFPDNTFDVILFTEIIEHLTFNPVAMWKGLYRILSPQGRIIVTTPNYYFYKGRAWVLKRLFSRMGGGLPVHEILNINTYGHHWKEFSAREIKSYFTLLSPDFQVTRLQYVDFYPQTNRHSRISKLENLLSIFLMQNIYAEMTLTAKDKGITIDPSWSPPAEVAAAIPANTPAVNELELFVKLTFTPPGTISWQLGPYLEHQGQYWVWSSIQADGQPNESSTLVTVSPQGKHVFAQTLSRPFSVIIKYKSLEGREVSSPSLVLDPTPVNIHGVVELNWP